MDIHRKKIHLASTSAIRAQLLQNAGVEITCSNARIDEDAIKAALLAEEASPRDIADTLAESKAIKISSKHPDDFVIGCDQVLSLKGELFSKSADKAAAKDQLRQLSGQTHHLISAVVIAEEARPVWRQINTVSLTMRQLTDEYIDAYLDRNWPDVSYCVGAYQLESEGVRLFSQIKGDYFTVLGLPLLETLSYLTTRGAIDG